MSARMRSRADRCPGALSLHEAADGLLARVRLPGGRVHASQLQGLAALTDLLEITSRANVQLRGVDPTVAEAVADLGLLPSATHERVRNIAAHPDPALDATVAELDARLQQRHVLAELPARFLFAVGGHPSADVVIDGPTVYAQRRRLEAADPVGAALDLAERFVRCRTSEWRLAELPPLLDGPVVGTPAPQALPAGLTPPLGRLTATMADELHGALVLTADRTVVTREPHVRPGWDDPTWSGVTACTGAPHCAHGLVDTAAVAARHRGVGRVHVVGCDHRCGRPAEPHTLIEP